VPFTSLHAGPSLSHTCTHMHTHAHTCTHMHTHAHTCTHMHSDRETWSVEHHQGKSVRYVMKPSLWHAESCLEGCMMAGYKSVHVLACPGTMPPSYVCVYTLHVLACPGTMPPSSTHTSHTHTHTHIECNRCMMPPSCQGEARGPEADGREVV